MASAAQVREGQAIFFAPINTAASADLVDAVAGKRIVVCSYFICNTTVTTTIKFQSGASTDLTGAMKNAQSVWSFAGPGPAFATEFGEKLNVVLGAGTQISGHLTYYLDD